MILLHREGRVAIVELARGKVNALDTDLLAALELKLEELAGDTDVSAIVLTGRERIFSAGVDLRRVVAEGPEYVEGLVASLRSALATLFEFPKPTVAAVNGPAIAGGCVAACSCDRRLAADTAKLGASELLVGVSFPAAAIEILRAACGRRTEDVIFGGQVFDARDALTIGMVDEVVAADELRGRAVEVADVLGSLQPEAFRLAKAQLRRPVVERIRQYESELDEAVTRQWAMADTRRRIEQQLDRLAER